MKDPLDERIAALIERAPQMGAEAFAIAALPLLGEAKHALRSRLVVQYESDADTFTFFHEDGPLTVAGGDVSTAFMRARAAVDAWRAVPGPPEWEGDDSMKRLEAVVYRERA